jgi:hypothetical protein
MAKNCAPPKQGTSGGPPAKTATGSGSRPGGGKYPIPSSNPRDSKNIRGK